MSEENWKRSARQIALLNLGLLDALGKACALVGALAPEKRVSNLEEIERSVIQDLKMTEAQGLSDEEIAEAMKFARGVIKDKFAALLKTPPTVIRDTKK